MAIGTAHPIQEPPTSSGIIAPPPLDLLQQRAQKPWSVPHPGSLTSPVSLAVVDPSISQRLESKGTRPAGAKRNGRLQPLLLEYFVAHFAVTNLKANTTGCDMRNRFILILRHGSAHRMEDA